MQVEKSAKRGPDVFLVVNNQDSHGPDKYNHEDNNGTKSLETIYGSTDPYFYCGGQTAFTPNFIAGEPASKAPTSGFEPV